MAKDSVAEKDARKQERAKTGTVRVDVTHKGKKTQEAVYKSEDKSFVLVADEPQSRGGQGEGPSPLGYFISGAATCLMMQYTNVLKEKPMPVESMKLLARAHNDRETRVFKDIIYQVDLTGSLSEADVETLARQASDRCFVENTLSKVIPITTEVHLNGKKVLSFTREP